MRYLDWDTSLVYGLVTSRLVSCNSLLFGLPAKDLAKLQIQTYSPYHHLHWLPVSMRITLFTYNSLLLTYKSNNGLSTNLSDLKYIITFQRGLCVLPVILSFNFHVTFLPNRVIKKMLCAALSLWNNLKLPHKIRNANNVNSFKPC